MFKPKRFVIFDDGPPLLQVVVDTEEEFDWRQPFSRSNISVRAIDALSSVQEILDSYGIKPTYVVDYPVVAAESSRAILKSFFDAGRCQIGTQLHPWVTPPFEEEVSVFNSYPGNLEPELERRKLEVVTGAVTSAFGTAPKIYKAGRYGVGEATAATLNDLGYLVDLSVVPHTDYSRDGGPDFRSCPDRPFWFGDSRQLLEIPLSRGFVGLAAGFGSALYPAVESKTGRLIHLGAILSRTGLLERIGLTPEGVDARSQLRLLRSLLLRGYRVFTLTLHSPSLVPGNTPYVKNQSDLRRLFDNIRCVLDSFFGVHGGSPVTSLELLARAHQADEGIFIQQLAPQARCTLPDPPRQLHHESTAQQNGVSVVVPAFNSAATIARALQSALAQTRPPLEIIVVDDHSSDATREIVSAYGNRNVKLIASTSRLGAGGARNAGIAAASGNLVAFLDADDEWLPTKLEKQVRLIESDEKLSFVACGSNMISPAGEDLGNLYPGLPITDGEKAWKSLLAYHFIATPAVLVWRRHLSALGGFDPRLKIGEDQDLWIRLAVAGSLGYVHESLVRVHLHSESVWSLDDLLTHTLPMVQRHINALQCQLSRREIREILGTRWSRIGRVAYARGQVIEGLSLVGRSMLLGYRPFDSLWYLAQASPPSIWLKRHLRRESRR